MATLTLFRAPVALFAALGIAMSAIVALPALAQERVTDFNCGSLENAVGPWDYRTTTQINRRLIELHHLDLEGALIQRGQIRGRLATSFGYAGGGIDYTLRAMPNHPQALRMADRYGQIAKSEFPPELPYPVECYFQRAIEWRADDAAVRLLYALYLVKRGRSADASRQLDITISLRPQDPSMDYNMGLAFLDLKQYDRALEYAHRAYAAGFPLPGLRERLRRVGRWVEPTAKSN